MRAPRALKTPLSIVAKQYPILAEAFCHIALSTGYDFTWLRMHDVLSLRSGHGTLHSHGYGSLSKLNPVCLLFLWRFSWGSSQYVYDILSESSSVRPCSLGLLGAQLAASQRNGTDGTAAQGRLGGSGTYRTYWSFLLPGLQADGITKKANVKKGERTPYTPEPSPYHPTAPKS